jgi:predicted heme/steroid binding protein
MFELSLEELAKFNGAEDPRVYLGFNGDIFDVSDVGSIFLWRG